MKSRPPGSAMRRRKRRSVQQRNRWSVLRCGAGEMAADAGRAVFRQAVPLRAEREKDQWTDAQAVDRYRSASRAAHTDGVGQKTEKISRNREILNRAQEVTSRRSDTLRPGAMRQKERCAMVRTVLLHFLREGMKLPKRPRALHKNRRRANLHGRLYKQPYRRPGVRAGCWHRPGRRRRGWRPPCYPGQAQRLPRRRLFWFWFSLRGWWGRFWLLPSACSFPTKRHRTGCSCGRRRRS